MSIFSNGMLLRRKSLVPMTLALMTGITASNNNSATITIPATAQVGDIAIFFQYAFNLSGTPGAVTITGTTDVANQVAGATSGIRAMLSYKILNAGDIGASRTGMNGSQFDVKTIRIIRPSKPITSITVGSVISQWGTSAFSQTISAPPDSPAMLVGRILNQQSALSPTGTIFTSGDRLNESSGNTNYATAIEIQNGPTMASRTIGTSATTGNIVGQSFYAVVT